MSCAWEALARYVGLALTASWLSWWKTMIMMSSSLANRLSSMISSMATKRYSLDRSLLRVWATRFIMAPNQSRMSVRHTMPSAFRRSKWRRMEATPP